MNKIVWTPNKDGRDWTLTINGEYKGMVFAYRNPDAFHAAGEYNFRNYDCKSLNDAAVKLMNHHGLKTTRE